MKLINILRLQKSREITKMYVQIQDGCHVVGQITLTKFKKNIYYAHLSKTHHYSPVAAL